MTHCELIEQGNRQPEHERTPEMLPVEPDRVGDELADRAIGRIRGSLHEGDAIGGERQRGRRFRVTRIFVVSPSLRRLSTAFTPKM